MSDASFEEGAEAPLRLKAEARDSLQVLSTLMQDAVLLSSDISWQPKRRRLILLVNRFRWEDHEAAILAKRPFERVRSILTINSALKVATNGPDPTDTDSVLSVLSMRFEEDDAPGGKLTLIMAGDGAIEVTVECLDLLFQDVSRPYLAQSKAKPSHEDAK